MAMSETFWGIEEWLEWGESTLCTGERGNEGGVWGQKGEGGRGEDLAQSEH